MHDSPSNTLHRLVRQGRNVLLTGQAGTGKSTLLRNELEHVGEDVATQRRRRCRGSTLR